MTPNEYPIFALSDVAVAELGAVIGFGLDPEHREAIETAANNRIVSSFFTAEDAAKKAMSPKLRADGTTKDSPPSIVVMRRALDRALKEWGNANRNSEFGRVLLHYDAELQAMGRRTLQDLMGEIQFHRIRLALHLRDRPNRKDSYAAFVRKLAIVYENVTGAVPTYAVERSSSPPPFLRFIQSMNGMLPARCRRAGVDTDGAWSKYLERALKADK